MYPFPCQTHCYLGTSVSDLWVLYIIWSFFFQIIIFNNYNIYNQSQVERNNLSPVNHYSALFSYKTWLLLLLIFISALFRDQNIRFQQRTDNTCTHIMEQIRKYCLRLCDTSFRTFRIALFFYFTRAFYGPWPTNFIRIKATNNLDRKKSTYPKWNLQSHKNRKHMWSSALKMFGCMTCYLWQAYCIIRKNICLVT